MTAAASARRRGADLLPPAPRRVRIGMPQLDAGGLSEGWLYRHCGDLHWEAIGRELRVTSDGFRGEAGDRLYPAVVALRARYGSPLADVLENDVLEADVRVTPCGRACAHGRIGLTVAGRSSGVELLTTFAIHDRRAGALRMAIPAPELAARWRAPADPPALSELAKAARAAASMQGSLEAGPPALGAWTHEPSPYADYNGAGLLYFAAYPTLADTAERKLVAQLSLANGVEWATSTSVVARDVFFYANLPLGESLVVQLMSFQRQDDRVRTHVRMRRAQGGLLMADLMTERRFVR